MEAVSPIMNLDEAMRFCGFKDKETFKKWREDNRCPCEIRAKSIFFHREVLNDFLRKLQTDRYYAKDNPALLKR